MSFNDIDVEEAVIGGVRGEWIRRKRACDEGRTSQGVVLFFHGGSFVRGNRSTDRAFCRELALNSSYDVYSTDYALAPEHPFPQGLDDCFNVYKNLCNDLTNGASNIVLCGESAGATRALSSFRHVCSSSAHYQAIHRTLKRTACSRTSWKRSLPNTSRQKTLTF